LAGSGADSWSKAPNVLYRNNAGGRLDGGFLEILRETVVWKQQRRGGMAGCLVNFLLAGLIVLQENNAGLAVLVKKAVVVKLLLR